MEFRMSTGSGLFDGNPLKTLIWLVVVSIIVGFVFVTLGIDPVALVRGIFANIDGILDAIVSLASWIAAHVGHYFIVGVIIVVPLWLISRLLASRKGR
jgi:hypothetical protein